MLELGNAYDEMGHHIEVAYHLDGQYLPKHGVSGHSCFLSKKAILSFIPYCVVDSFLSFLHLLFILKEFERERTNFCGVKGLNLG